MNYNPNMTLCGRSAKQTVKLTFGLWEYRAEMTAVVGGNCTGLDVIEAAVDRAFKELIGDGDFARLTMKMPNGYELICEDDEDDEEAWLQKMLIGAEILSIEPNGSIFGKAEASA